ncbi:MAG: hypothetical protein HY708_02105, partial [Ignavibacteriae bacterium]|nr:hypothetical protein [Ignavibacteriota bacterium]
MLVWQSRRNGNLDIWYSVRTNGNWGTPASLTLDAEDDQRPHVVIRDSGFVVVWERNGHILFSQYVNSQWSPPELVTPTGDSLNSCPQVEIASPFPGTLPIVTWQKQKSSDTTFAVMYSYRSGNSWSSPDTVAYSGDNRNPKFFKATPLWYGEAVSWVVQASTGSSEILTRSLSSVGGLPTWEAPVSLHSSWNLIRNPVVNGYIIIVGNAPPFLRFSVASWESSFLEAESIAVTLQWTDPTMLSPDLLSTNRNPDVSSGRLDPTAGFAVRFWSVWESNATDTVKLWGSNILIVLSDVPTNGTPNEFALHQNYPNPFNPRTKIVYRVGSRESVELRIFDVLGREVATLVNE